MQSQESACPFEQGQQRPKRLAVDVRVEQEGQRLLDKPARGIETLSSFEDDLENDYYRLMRQHLPAKAARLIARTLRQTAFAAMSSEVYTELLRQITPRLERGEGLADYEDAPTEYRPANGDTVLPGYVWRGSAAQFIHRMVGLLSDASRRTFDIAENHPSSRPHYLWEVLEGAHTQLVWNGGVVAPHPDVRKSWFQSMEANADTVLEVLLRFGQSYTLTCGRFPPKRMPLRAMIRNLDALTWGATANGSVSGSMLHANPLTTEFHRYQERVLNDVQLLFEGHESIFGPFPPVADGLTYAHPSLSKGPWPKSGFCPGVPILQPPEQSDQDIVERFFVAMEKHFGGPIPRLVDEKGEGVGAFDRITVAVLLGMLVAEETILETWPRDSYTSFCSPSMPYLGL